MCKKLFIIFFLIGIIGYSADYIYKHSIPKRGTILRYENFKGYKAPIKADGCGGSYRWIGDVPWGAFTMEEKCAIAFSNGGILNDEDVEEIRQKYGSGRRRR